MHISPYCHLALVLLNFMKFGIQGQLTDVITCVKLLVNWLRGYRVLTPQNCPLPSTCCVALTTVYTLPCDTVIVINSTHVYMSICAWLYPASMHCPTWVMLLIYSFTHALSLLLCMRLPCWWLLKLATLATSSRNTYFIFSNNPALIQTYPLHFR